MHLPLKLLAGAALLVVVGTTSGLAQDAAAGATVFKKCAACHVVNEAKNKVGPHLVGIIDRPVASIEGYKYSKAMIEYVATTPLWTEEALTAYLKDPKGVVKGTKMAFVGLKKDEDIANVIAYLKAPPAAN